ncbi:sulfurtransferase-like selenium metabolism protein YedF [Desulfonatronospira sp.]|uniref:sulfurtransferase-like selenium metabolism protein YedF n=1 Tax=Desulfonatronospira sp. TaxID=1962951 RepID=UPI0025C043C3|nr:sulfurtransferase-like selenium metabolism protein YedF [Desulfonatronospira sp.]
MSRQEKVDCRGLPCPQPVLKSREIIDSISPDTLQVQVDNEPALENVSRFLSTQGYVLEKPEKNGDIWTIHASRGEAPAAESSESAAPGPGAGETLRTLVFVSTSRLGSGDDELGSKLMQNFIKTLPEMGSSLWMVVFVNSGVKLAVKDSPVLETVQRLEENQVKVLVCGTCLEFFGLTDAKEAGQTTNMLDIITAMSHADKVITV